MYEKDRIVDVCCGVDDRGDGAGKKGVVFRERNGEIFFREKSTEIDGRGMGVDKAGHDREVYRVGILENQLRTMCKIYAAYE